MMKYFQFLFFLLPLLCPPGCSLVPVHHRLVWGELSAEEWINTLLDMEDRVVSRVLQLGKVHKKILGREMAASINSLDMGEFTLVIISNKLTLLQILSYSFIQGRLHLDLQGLSLGDGSRSRFRDVAAAKRQAWDTAQSRAVIPYPRIGKRGEEEEGGN